MYLSRFKSEHDTNHEAESVQLQSVTTQRDNVPLTSTDGASRALSGSSANVTQEGSTWTSGKVVFEGIPSSLGGMTTDHATVVDKSTTGPAISTFSGFVLPDSDQVCSGPEDWGLDDRWERGCAVVLRTGGLMTGGREGAQWS